MTTEQLKNWIKTQDADFSNCIQLGGVNGNATKFLGVYPGVTTGKQHIAIGGPSCTSYDTLSARLLLRWGKSQPEAEVKAKGLRERFYGLSGVEMDGAAVILADPGAGPVYVGKGTDGVFEYVINLNIIYKKE